MENTRVLAFEPFSYFVCFNIVVVIGCERTQCCKYVRCYCIAHCIATGRKVIIKEANDWTVTLAFPSLLLFCCLCFCLSSQLLSIERY